MRSCNHIPCVPVLIDGKKNSVAKMTCELFVNCVMKRVTFYCFLLYIGEGHKNLSSWRKKASRYFLERLKNRKISSLFQQYPFSRSSTR